MSFAFEVTTDDILIVLNRNGKAVTAQEELDAIHSSLDFNRIEKDILYYDDLDEQTDAAYKSIEAQLKESGVL